MADSYYLTAVQGGHANIYHYTTAPPQNPRAIYLGSSLQQAQQNLSAAFQKSKSKFGTSQVSTQVLNEQGAPSAGELITAGLSFVGANAATLDTTGIRAFAASVLAAGGAAAKGALSGAGSTAAKAALGSGLLGVLGGSDIEQFAIRVLEGLVGIALVFLGLQALTGMGDGTPAAVVKTAAKYAR